MDVRTHALLWMMGVGAVVGCQDLLSLDVVVPGLADAGPDGSGPGADAMATATCSDGQQNSDESDVDCGGSCPRCAAGQRCNSSGDCQSGAVCDELCRLPVNCHELLHAGATSDGMYTIDPDGADDRFATLSVACDMSSDGGGWTLVGDYRSDLELFDYRPVVHQQQNKSGGATLTEPPVLDGMIHGHLAHDMITASHVRLQCRPEGATDWFGVRSDRFADWSPGDKGTYGAEQWGVVGYQSFGRSHHFICGQQVNLNDYFGIALCSGPGQGGSFINHLVSLSFTRSRSSYTGGLSIGCNGTGLNNGKEAQWRARVWLR
ncbi:MAG: hypothetical protein MJE77_12855 [Proteobacteria bacterium]|nr:hypothetical protein [Pseudomonadota bacterium]